MSPTSSTRSPIESANHGSIALLRSRATCRNAQFRRSRRRRPRPARLGPNLRPTVGRVPRVCCQTGADRDACFAARPSPRQVHLARRSAPSDMRGRPRAGFWGMVEARTPNSPRSAILPGRGSGRASVLDAVRWAISNLTETGTQRWFLHGIWGCARAPRRAEGCVRDAFARSPSPISGRLAEMNFRPTMRQLETIAEMDSARATPAAMASAVRDAMVRPHIASGYDAVKNALTERWSNGKTEGQINRLKPLKRAMYSRAGANICELECCPSAAS